MEAITTTTLLGKQYILWLTMDPTTLRNRFIYFLLSDLDQATLLMSLILCFYYISFISAINRRECDLGSPFRVDVADRRGSKMSLISNLHQNRHDEVSKFTGPFQRVACCLLPAACCLLPTVGCCGLPTTAAFHPGSRPLHAFHPFHTPPARPQTSLYSVVSTRTQIR